MKWENYGYVVASKYRRKVVLALTRGELTPKQIAERTGLYLSHVCSVLTELNKRGIVTCLTPNLRRGKVYVLSSEGGEIALKIKVLDETNT